MPRFEPGHRRIGGRLAGTPNRATQEMKAFARLILESDEYRESLRRRIFEGKAPHLEVLMWHYAYGKPRETVAFESTDPQKLNIVVRYADKLPPEKPSAEPATTFDQ